MTKTHPNHHKQLIDIMYNTLEEYKKALDEKCMETFLVGTNDMFDDEEIEVMFRDQEDIDEVVVAKSSKYGLDSVSYLRADGVL